MRCCWLQLLACCLLVCFTGAAQELKPQTISSEAGKVLVTLKLASGNVLTVESLVTFTPTQGNRDDTLTGELVFRFSRASRDTIAQAGKLAITELPEQVVVKDVIAEFEKHAVCPALRFEFRQCVISFVDVKGLSEGFKLSFLESDHELSKMLCLWAKRIEMGRGGQRGVIARFNELLKGKEGN